MARILAWSGVLFFTLLPGTRASSFESREWLEEQIEMLLTGGTLNPFALYASQDDAAVAVLSVIAPYAQRAGLEVGGSLVEYPEGWSYTVPHVGSSNGIFVPYEYAAYHTHPNRRTVRFSNRFQSYGGGPADAEWVQATGYALYLAVSTTDGAVSIGVCDPGRCSSHHLTGTPPSRMLETPARRP